MEVNGYQQYKQQTVMTMTQGELLIMLYDELLKRLARAEFSLEKNNFKDFEDSIQRSIDIVRYLKNTLNLEYEISSDLYKMYDFYLYQLARIKAGRKGELIADVKDLVKEMRDAFAQADVAAMAK